jgi:Putative Ig domain
MLKGLFPLGLVLLASPLFGQSVITTSALPNPIVGKAVSGAVWTLNASAGTPPYTWNVSVGNLPAGLSLSPAGTIIGTATSAGASTFTVRVTDSASAVATKQFTITAQNAIGRGCTTATVIDWDCDYYGVGSPLGPDADDNDITVNTPATMLAKYGTLANFLSTVEGYNPLHIWYLDSAAGNDSTCAINDVTKPCRTWAIVRTKVVSGDAIIVRAGTIDENVNYDLPSANGTQAHPNIVMAYPGELAVFDHTNSSTNYYGFEANPLTDQIIDGIKLTHSGMVGLGMGINLSGPGALTRVTIRSCEIRDYFDGIWAIAGSSGLLIEKNVIHDDDSEHNIYVGQNSASSGHITGLIVQDNILYNAFRDNFHNNGICDGCTLTRNIMYSSNLSPGGGASNISLQQGWNHGTVSNNIVFVASAYAMIINDYDDGQPGIKPFDQNHNLIVNNTFIHTGRDSSGQNLSNSGFCALAVINNSSQTSPLLDLGNNTYSNNILIEGATGGSIGNCVVRYGKNQSGDLDWLSTDTWTNNILYANNGAAPIYVGIGLGSAQTWAYFQSHAASFTGNLQTDPMLIAWNPAWYTAPENYNLALQAGSPAAAAGTATGAPAIDIRGLSRSGSANIGIGAYLSLTVAFSTCDLNGDGVVNALDVTIAEQQALGILPCSTADLHGNGRCDVVDIQIIIIAALTGTCR